MYIYIGNMINKTLESHKLNINKLRNNKIKMI